MGASWWDLLDPKTKHTIIKTGKLPQRKKPISYEKYLEGYGKDAKVKKKWVRSDTEEIVIHPIPMEPEKCIEPYLPQIKEKLKKVGVSSLKKLKSGSYGIAYRTNKGDILKLTTDEDEAKTSSKLVGSKLKHVVKIYRVFRFSTIKNLWFIEQEELDKLDSKTEDILNICFGVKMNTITIKYIEDFSKSISSTKKENLLDFFINERVKEPEDLTDRYLNALPVLKKYPLARGFFVFLATWKFNNKIHKLYSTKAKIEKIEEILESIQNLRDLGIKFIDTHKSNLMRKGKVLKWIDLGRYSQAKGTEKIDIIKADLKLFRKNYSVKITNKNKGRIEEVASILKKLAASKNFRLSKKIKRLYL